MSTDSLLVELGTEELPPKALKSLGLAFRDGIVEGLVQRELEFGEVKWFATPRRLAVLIDQVQLQAADKEMEALGPPVDRARDEQGAWTAAAIGFAKKQGVEPEQLEHIDTPKGARLGLRTRQPGITAGDCLNEIINDSIKNLPIPKRMRWGANRVEFVRPVHWIVALLGQQSDFGNILGLNTGNSSEGHRFHSEGSLVIERPEDYPGVLKSARVIADFDERQALIRAQVEAEANQLGAHAVIDQALLDEVTGLVEWPVALTGSFDEQFLQVPAEALISSMKEHQKYFHLVDKNGQLLPNFITISNIESTDPAQVIDGNERVIRPRLADAAFFYETDRKTPLQERVDTLARIVFQQQLGTLKDKTDRMVGLAKDIAVPVGADPDQAARAALLSKADLGTEMVLEFSDMQGTAGRYYALHDGETEQVADAMAQQYWPKFAGDQLPQNPVAATLALADRLDTLVGIFGIGQPPTGSKDPFALRRASLAVLRIMVETELDLDLRECLDLAAARYPEGTLADGTVDQVLDYMIERFRAWYEDEQIPVEVFKSVSSKRLSQPLDIHRRVLAVHAFTSLPEAQSLAAANKRVSNILSKVDSAHNFQEVSANLLVEAEEKELSSTLNKLATDSNKHFNEGRYTESLAVLAGLREAIDAFFDNVMVNAEDESLRNNRLNLLKALRDQFLQVADISQLVVGK